MARKATYWKAKCLDDADVYSIRRRTKREVLKVLEAFEREGSRDDYADPVQVFVEYASVLDLVFDAQSEEGLWEQEA